jgi:alpha-galactosidase
MMDRKYQFTRFTQISDIFPRPNQSNWDGCYKFNGEKQGGVLFFYRNGSLEATRTFHMPIVDSNTVYRLYSPEDNRIIRELTGKELMKKGITVTIPHPYEAKVIGIEKRD